MKEEEKRVELKLEAELMKLYNVCTWIRIRELQGINDKYYLSTYNCYIIKGTIICSIE